MNESENTLKEQLLDENLRVIDSGMNIQREVVEKHEKTTEQVIRYTYQVMTTIGVVGGFGFTGLAFVKNIYLFTIGEGLLFTAIAVGMWFVQKGFNADLKLFTQWQNAISKVLGDRMKITAEDSEKEMWRKMEIAKNEELNIFKGASGEERVDFLSIIFALFILGGLVLLSSFIVYL